MSALIAIHFTVVGQEQLPFTFDSPSKKKRGFRIFDICDIMGKTFPEDTRSLNGVLFLKIFQEFHTRHIIGNSSTRSGKYGGEEIDGRNEFGAIGGIKASVRPGEHDGCANTSFVGRLLGARGVSVLFGFWIQPLSVTYTIKVSSRRFRFSRMSMSCPQVSSNHSQQA